MITSVNGLSPPEVNRLIILLKRVMTINIRDNLISMHDKRIYIKQRLFEYKVR